MAESHDISTQNSLSRQESTLDVDASPAYALVLSYDGTDFAGYAKQSAPPQRSVQEELERALCTALHLPPASLSTVVAGRTDAGVHAFGQVVSFTCPETQLATEAGRRVLLRSLNALTPRDLSIRALHTVPPDFSARFDAVSREYRYRIAPASAPPLFTRRYAWHLPNFGTDHTALARLKHAASALVGTHDFSSFAVTASLAGKNPVRELLSINLVPLEFFGEQLFELRIVGTAFLHSMVRVITGTLVEVYEGRIEHGALPAILAVQRRSAAGRTAPACGLTLFDVQYQTFSSGR
jgi:tRNA pseudouridine38-40 synthase